MTNVRHFLALAAGLAIASLAVAAPAHADESESWIEVGTEHFLVRTNASRERAVALATDLEKYRFTIGYLSGLDTRETPAVPVTVYAYRKTDQYLDETGAYGTAGFYSPQQTGPVSMLTLEDGEEDWQLAGKRVLFHEYTHHILHQLSPIEYPRWYDEGFAEYMATMEFDDGSAVIGKPALHRVPSLKRVSDWVRAFEIIESGGRYLGRIGTNLRRDPRRAKTGQALQYAQGWLMVHFLHSQDRLQRGIPRYLRTINRADVDDEKAFEQAFGMTYKQFDRAVKRYWADKEFATGRVEIASRMPEVEPRIREMHPCEVDAATDEAMVLIEGFDNINEGLARDRFKACLDNGVRPRDMRLALTRLALADEDWGRAERQIDALLAANGEDAAAMTEAIRLERLRAEDELDGDVAASLRKRAVKAIMADPTYVPALIQYADITFEHDLSINDNTTSVIDSIRFLAPDLGAGKVFEARLFAHKGAGDEALALLDEMIKWSNSTGEEVRLKEIREEIEKELKAG